MRALLLALLFTTACTSDKKEAANQDPASTPATTTRTAQREADDKATEVEQARNAAKADVATAQAASDTTAARANAETTAQLQKTFDAADRRLTELKERAASATGATKERVDAAVAEATAREANVMAGIARLRDASGAAWDTAKAQLDADIVAMNQALVSLEIALK
ncbi:MAG: hypothetical protein H0T46_07800 [Deltaproteobacteria bacterium]|nr:hypothetical protein [Deltaproteobacteria bacterium]